MPDTQYMNNERPTADVMDIKRLVVDEDITMEVEIEEDAFYSIHQGTIKTPLLVAVGAEVMEHFETDNWKDVINSNRFIPGIMYNVRKLENRKYVLVWQQPCSALFRNSKSKQTNNLDDDMDNDTMTRDDFTQTSSMPFWASQMQSTRSDSSKDTAMLFDRLQSLVTSTSEQQSASHSHVVMTLQEELQSRNDTINNLRMEMQDYVARLRDAGDKHSTEISILNKQYYDDKTELQKELQEAKAQIVSLNKELDNERWKANIEKTFNDRQTALEKTYQKKEKAFEDSSSMGLSDLMPLINLASSFAGKGGVPAMPGMADSVAPQQRRQPTQEEIARYRQRQAQQQAQAQKPMPPNIEYQEVEDTEEEE